MTVSLNTQGANKISQRLYLRMGFNEMLERPMEGRKFKTRCTMEGQGRDPKKPAPQNRKRGRCSAPV